MPAEHFPAGPPRCSACGQRPATVRLQYESPGSRGEIAVCQPCALRYAQTQTVPPAQPEAPTSGTPALDDFGRDLTAEAAAGRIDPVVGRTAEIEQTIETLARRRKNNVVLIG